MSLFLLWRELALLPGDEFVVSEVIAWAMEPEKAGLRLALEEACGVNPRALGKLLSRWRGCDLAGVRVNCLEDDSNVCLWKVTRRKPKPESPSAAIAANVAPLPPLGQRK